MNLDVDELEVVNVVGTGGGDELEGVRAGLEKSGFEAHPELPKAAVMRGAIEPLLQAVAVDEEAVAPLHALDEQAEFGAGHGRGALLL